MGGRWSRKGGNKARREYGNPCLTPPHRGEREPKHLGARAAKPKPPTSHAGKKQPKDQSHSSSVGTRGTLTNQTTPHPPPTNESIEVLISVLHEYITRCPLSAHTMRGTQHVTDGPHNTGTSDITTARSAPDPTRLNYVRSRQL